MMNKIMRAANRRHWIFTSGCNKPEKKGDAIVEVFKNTYNEEQTKKIVRSDEYVSQR